MSGKKKQTVENKQKNAMPPEPPEEHTAPPEELNESQSSDATATDVQTNGEAPAETEAKAETNTALEEKPAEAETPSEAEKTVDKGAVIDPIAFEVKLKSIHPQATYGRCGYRFNKETAVEIPREALTGKQIITLAEDPYLEFIPVTEA